MSNPHYENFPVASWLCPPALRAPILAIYQFARTADDIADEGHACAAERQADLQAYRDDLQALACGNAPSTRWQSVMQPLAQAINAHHLPIHLLDDLLSAFLQDTHQTSYADREELLDYCRRSANPVGRLLLHLYGVNDALALKQSDAICSALQLANFWQDLSIDCPRGRIYVPGTELREYAVLDSQLMALEHDISCRLMLHKLVDWAEQLMLSGAPLVHQLPGCAGWELRLVVQGGLRILEKIKNMNYTSLTSRPKVNGTDAPKMIWRAMLMRKSPEGLT